MTKLPHTTRLMLAATFLVAGACRENPSELPLAPPATAALSRVGSSQFQFEPLASTGQCVANGTGDRFILPAGFSQTIIARESEYRHLLAGNGADLGDMHTQNENGPQAGRYLYRTHEVGSNGAVTRTDLWTGLTTLVTQDIGYRRLDGIAWTQWGTLLFAEETAGGRLFEWFPATNTVVTRAALGLRPHEGIRLDAQGNVYGISETTPGYVFKFVPDVPGDLSSGRNFALRVADPSRTGAATWAEINLAAFAGNSVAAAAAVGATGWGRPEDLETSTSTGNNQGGAQVLYVAITSENKVLRIELNGNDAYVSNFIDNPPGFSSPDNLALSKSGDLYIAEDNGFPDDIWMAPTGGRVATSVVRFASLIDCGAEPTGIYFDKQGWTLYVNVQHASWENGDDLAIAIRRTP